MSEVKRYDCTNGKAQHCYGCYEMTETNLGDYVKFEDFDRVTAERDAFKETLERWHELNLQREAKVYDLQQRLTAADERADVLEGLLRKAHPFTNDVAHDDDIWLEIHAALKPAEGDGDDARIALRPENQRITPARFKCLACGEYHEGSGNLPCPSMSPYSRIEQ